MVDTEAQAAPAADSKEVTPSAFWAIFLVALALIIASYSNALKGDFVYDDQWQIVRNPLIQSPSFYAKALTSDVWSFRQDAAGVGSNYYRPVFTAWSILNFKLFGLEPAGWHAANIGLHVVVTLLVIILLFRLGLPAAGVALCAWIFAAHPVHVESVTWIAGSPDMLMAGFVLGSLLSWMGYRKTGRARNLIGSLLLFLLALGSKETAAALVPLVVALSLLLEKKGLGSAIKDAAPLVAATLVFFGARHLVMRGAGINVQNPVGWNSMLATAPQVLWFYLKQTFWPFELSSAYELRAVTRQSMGFATFWGPLAGSIAAIAAACWASRKSRLAGLGIMIFTVFLLPAFYIRAFAPEHVVRDRYLYLPLLGLCLAIVAAALPLIRRAPRVAYAAAGSVSAALAVATYAYNPVWHSELALWTRGVETDPAGSMAHMQLAAAHLAAKDYDEAIVHAERAVSLNPKLIRPLTILGMAHKGKGNLGLAIQSFESAIASGIDTQIPAENLASVYVEIGQPHNAIKVFEEEMARNPSARAVCTRNIAVLLVQAGKSDEALRRLESIKSELKAGVAPRAVASWFFMAELYFKAGRHDDAVEAYRRFLADSKGMVNPELPGMRQTAAQTLELLDSRR